MREQLLLSETIDLKNQSRVSNNRTKNFMASTDGQFDVVKLMLTNQSKALRISLNVRDMNGMTLFCFSTVIRYSRVLFTKPASYHEYSIWCRYKISIA